MPGRRGSGPKIQLSAKDLLVRFCAIGAFDDQQTAAPGSRSLHNSRFDQFFVSSCQFQTMEISFLSLITIVMEESEIEK